MTTFKIQLIALLSMVAIANTACDKKEDSKSSATPAATDGIAETSSQDQLKNAEYKNEQARKLLSKYTTGREFCKKFDSVTSKENGERIKVPVDYKDPAKGSTEIYAFFAAGKYDPNLPTFIFFDGGPGGNSHGVPPFTKGYNQLHFDQRGIGCSRPSKLEQYRDPNFYSSENTARDAEEIRKYLKIPKMSIFGGSYGTVPATIYGSHFPEVTTAVALEGVIFSSTITENSHIVHHNLKKMYSKFPQPTKEAMLKYFTPDKAYAIYLAARMTMYKNNGFKKIQEGLLAMFPSIEGTDLEKANQAFDPNLFQKTFFEEDSISTVEAINNHMLSCKESGDRTLTASVFYQAKTGNETKNVEFELVEIKDQESAACKDLDIPEDPTPYSADKYPLKVPVTYFQGTWDGATMAKGAIQHWKKVPKAQRQLFLAVEGGHSPNVTGLMDLKRENVRNAQRELFEKVLAGKLSSTEEAKALNANQTEVKWVYTQKEVEAAQTAPDAETGAAPAPPGPEAPTAP